MKSNLISSLNLIIPFILCLLFWGGSSTADAPSSRDGDIGARTFSAGKRFSATIPYPSVVPQVRRGGEKPDDPFTDSVAADFSLAAFPLDCNALVFLLILLNLLTLAITAFLLINFFRRSGKSSKPENRYFRTISRYLQTTDARIAKLDAAIKRELNRHERS